mmetsp:Transcript_4529/g.7011  ORF Transcript_4529/g.7011 Transcript_4529/m.7011 type:complete len:351 (-) Transcript_4529:1608-2660(-)|eukprot:CAMPEP_0184656432 /NCGR_PEP_ID=MMETSP0308-20130426/16504_1 /TAXON_ID=38269 /ORGANISM="Gloeochaete witrockiana, Strain SAG 46.84" /LENGTH=350 /DNA_ID=CAMNT_0027093567 /DNA_START=264 /DNA_END=1316 /DNA_ORIENTATION=-
MVASSRQSLHQLGKEILKEAVDADEKGMFHVAADLYGQCAELFMKEIEEEKRKALPGWKERAEKARGMAAGAIERAEKVKAIIGPPPNVTAPQRLAPVTPPRHHVLPSAPPGVPSAPPFQQDMTNSAANPPTVFSPPEGAAASAKSELRMRMLRGVVQILCGNGSGSGSLISRTHILTNYHVIDFGEQTPIFIGITPLDVKSPPQIRYIAKRVAVDTVMDLALLKIVADYKDQHNPDFVVDLEPVVVGESSSAMIGDKISVIGFPGIGGKTVTLTKGTLSGYMDNGSWIKTDAEINPGNSGGGAFKDFKLVGVASAASESSNSAVSGKIGLLRPIELARPLISQARQLEK